MTRTATRLGVAGTILSVIGLGFASYLAYEHFAAESFQGCVLGGGCQQVTTSSYASFLGIPVVIPGVFYFVVSIGLHLPASWRSSNIWLGRARWAWSVVGMISVFYLIYGELSVGAICMYCTGVHVVTFLLLVLTAIGSASLIPDDATFDGTGDGDFEAGGDSDGEVLITR